MFRVTTLKKVSVRSSQGVYPAPMVKEKRLGEHFPFDRLLLDFELEDCGLTTGLLLPFSMVKMMLEETSCLLLEGA